MSEFKYNLAIASIMKYEEPYVEEWVKYHLCVGVKHIYIYDNNEESTMKEVLAKYIDNGDVNLIPMYGERKLFEAYQHALINYRDVCKYIAFIDADEFLVPIEDVLVDQVVEDLFNKYDDGHVAALTVRWQVYGTGNHKTKPDGLVIENYLYQTNATIDRHVKSIVNPRKTRDFGNPHFGNYDPGCYAIDEDGNRVNGPFNDNGGRNIIRLNHYYYKSEEEFLNGRLKRGKCDINVTEEQLKKIIEDQYYNMVNSNRVYDDLMLRYVDRIR